MIDIVISTGRTNPPKLDYSPRPLEPAPSPANRENAPANTSNYIRVLGSPAQNSRAPGSLRSGQWKMRWKSPTSKPPSTVLIAGTRILAERSGGWTLFDLSGKLIAEGTGGQAVITIDPNAGMFYDLGGGNDLQAIGLENGTLRFKIPLGHNESFRWPMFLRSGKRLVAVGIGQKMLAPKGNAPPPTSLFQVIEIGSPLKMSPYKILLSLELQQEMIFSEANLLPVASGDILWAVFPNLLIRTSPAETIDGAWSGSFKALSASADEAGWLYLVVAQGDPPGGDRELWVITPDGRRTMRAPVPPAYAESRIPPAVGYDHRVYLRSSRSVVAFSPQGALLWESLVPSGIVGMSLTPDGEVVVAAGADVLAIDPNGKVRLLAALPATATTTPVVTQEGEILVGTEAGVACLSVR